MIRSQPRCRSLLCYNIAAVQCRLRTPRRPNLTLNRGQLDLVSLTPPILRIRRYSAMKRNATASFEPTAKRRAAETGKNKESSPPAPEYCDATPVTDAEGTVWPAARSAMTEARDFIREAASSGKKILLVPDKDADGLSAGVLMHRTLLKLGVDPGLLDVHLLAKGTTVHDQSERDAMAQKAPGYVVVLDIGSRSGPRIIEDESVKSLVIDHHLSNEFPTDAQVVSACHFPPVATSALLTFEICKELSPDVEPELAYLAAIGTVGDLGTSLKWKPPFPDLSATFKEHTKKSINDAVSLLNAPRRTATFDVKTAWGALLASEGPKSLLKNNRLLDARAEINIEVEKNTHAPPKFSKDGRIAVLRIHTPAQVHPVIATRWAGFLKSTHLEIVMVANSGYLPGMVNFSCRIAKCARNKDPPVNIIDTLKDIAALDQGDLEARMGDSFARGHKEASGGIIPEAEFEELMSLIKLGEKPDKPPGAPSKSPKKNVMPAQKNNLKNYFAVK